MSACSFLRSFTTTLACALEEAMCTSIVTRSANLACGLLVVLVTTVLTYNRSSRWSLLGYCTVFERSAEALKFYVICLAFPMGSSRSSFLQRVIWLGEPTCCPQCPGIEIKIFPWGHIRRHPGNKACRDGIALQAQIRGRHHASE